MVDTRAGIQRPVTDRPPNAPRPLAGLSVVEMGALIAGPFCTKILAEFGADVVKLEPRQPWKASTSCSRA